MACWLDHHICSSLQYRSALVATRMRNIIFIRLLIGIEAIIYDKPTVAHFVYITSLTLTSSIILRHKSLVMAMVGETLNLYCLPIERKLYTTLWRLRFICSVSSAFPSLVMIGNIYSVSEVYLSAICCIALSHLIVTAGLLSDVWEM